MPRLLNLGLAALLLLLTIPAQHAMAQGGEPSRAPVLRIETGMHTATIRMSVDAANRYLVTASDDKTLRVWGIPSGRPLRVIRPPISEGLEGRLYAVAISPDGTTIATGGITGVQWEDFKSASFYIFDRESGKLLRRVPGLPASVTGLAYSNDGQLLAATMGSRVRVYRTSDYMVVGEGNDSDRVGEPSFDGRNRLVIVSVSGLAKLYAIEGNGNNSLRLLNQ